VVTDESNQPKRHSASAEAAARRWHETHPDDDLDHDAPSHVPEGDGAVPNRHSASAEAAALRWRERHSSVWASPTVGDDKTGEQANRKAGPEHQ
jgi:hypothetical protein